MGSFYSTANEEAFEQPHVPIKEDVYNVRHALLNFLPAELANTIIDEARYWPNAVYRHHAKSKETWAIQQNNSPSLCLLTPKLSEWFEMERWMKVKEIRIKTHSHDQGWCSDQTSYSSQYMGSWTWFEAIIVHHYYEDLSEADLGKALMARGEHDTKVSTRKNPSRQDPDDVWHVQRNQRGCRDLKVHEVIWTDAVFDKDVDEKKQMDDTGSGLGIGFVQSMSPGDRIAIMAMARYPGWRNIVTGVDIEVYYSV